MWVRRFDEAIEARTKAAEIQPAWTGPLGGTLARAGRTEEPRAILEQFKSGPISPRSAFWIAYIHLTLGEYDQVFEWLEYRPADPWISAVRVWPEYRVLHDDPRFHDLLDELRLPPVEQGVSL